MNKHISKYVKDFHNKKNIYSRALTFCHLIITMYCMKLIMDSDCLIKLTKARLKELVCKNFDIFIPQTVKREVIDNAAGYPDAEAIKENLEKGLVTLAKQKKTAVKGEDAVYEVFKEGPFDAICSDDKRFIKRLRFFDIPYITPSVFIGILIKKREITLKEAHKKLIALSLFISDDEYNAVKIILENWREQ
tara:strand:+ start:207 stop:779 length:573 start_codon:yes stop_codon:yes gene_type:complete